MNSKSFFIASSVLLSFSFTIAGCGSSSSSSSSSETDSTSNVSQASMSEAGSQSTAGESGSAPGFLSSPISSHLSSEISADLNDVNDFVDSQDQLHPLASTCTWSSVRSTCSSGSRTIAWSGCTIDRGNATLTGGWNESYSESACTMSTNGDTLTRTTPSGGSVLTTAAGASITSDTSGGTTYSSLAVPSTGTRITTTAGGRTIDIHGTHRVRVGKNGKTVFDHFITTDTLASTVGGASAGSIAVSGTKAAANRQISSGTITIYHELAKYTASTTFSNVVWGSTACCYPTSGSINATLSGSVTGNTSLQFSTTCGVANFTDTTGATSSITLDQCN